LRTNVKSAILEDFFSKTEREREVYMQQNSLVGNVVANPVLNKGDNPWTKLRVAAEEGPNTLFLDIFFSGKLAEQICQYLEKGRTVYVQYTIKNGEYVKDNVKVKSFDFYGSRCDFLGSRKNEKDNK
jgi:single-stranded DNA-binding protein